MVLTPQLKSNSEFVGRVVFAPQILQQSYFSPLLINKQSNPPEN
ncbi:hypothetical protein PPECC33_p3234 (plasmid) [Escherichia coli PCN033]|nr:hypothetical protein PPECC33_p3234 [Escherichia coli PCN033]